MRVSLKIDSVHQNLLKMRTNCLESITRKHEHIISPENESNLNHVEWAHQKTFLDTRLTTHSMMNIRFYTVICVSRSVRKVSLSRFRTDSTENPSSIFRLVFLASLHLWVTWWILQVGALLPISEKMVWRRWQGGRVEGWRILKMCD